MHFPSKLIEYMGVGKWILSTPIAHSERDYSEYLDFLYDLNPNALSLKLDQISRIPKKELFEKGVKARKFILENRTWKMRTKEIVNYIRRR